MVLVRADLDGTTLSHATYVQQAYGTNWFVYIKSTTCLRLSCTTRKIKCGRILKHDLKHRRQIRSHMSQC